MENERKFYGWKLVGALWVTYLLNMGFVLYGGVVIHSYMMKEIMMDRATYGLAFTVHNFCVGVPAVLVGATVAKYGIKATMWIGSALLIIGSLWMAMFTTQPWHYVVGFGAIMGLGVGFSTIVPLSTAITRWFVKLRGRAMALAMTASGFAGFVAAPITTKIMAANGGDWRQAWFIICGLVCLSVINIYFFIKERPEDIGQIPDGVSAESVSKVSENALSGTPLVSQYMWTPAEAYRTKSFWFVFVGAIASGYPFYFFTAHWMPHMRGVGIGAVDAAWVMGLFTMGGIGGRLIGGWLMDRIAARYAFILGLCIYLVGSVLAMNISSTNLFVASAAGILYGAAFGWTFVCQNTVIGNFFGPKWFPKINGTLFSMAVLTGCWSGALGGKLFDMFKSYNQAFELNMVIVVIGIIAMTFAKMPEAPVTQSGKGVSQ